jgi:hypothetical protein
MKKALIVIAFVGSSVAAFAQDKPEPLVNRDLIFDVIHICAILTITYLIASFILQLFRGSFDFRLKSKMLDRQTDENIVGKIVQSDRTNPLAAVLQWVCVLASVGIGFLLIELTEPFGLHSLAIMALCVAAGLGLYYYFASRAKK